MDGSLLRHTLRGLHKRDACLTKSGVRHFLWLKQSALAQLKELLIESMSKDALSPRGFEMDDYTRSRNTIVAGAISAWCLINGSTSVDGVDVNPIITLLAQEDRNFVWGESALPMVLCMLWVTEKYWPELDVIAIVRSYVEEACNRNTIHSDDEPIQPPQTDPDTILERLFAFEPTRNRPPKAKHLWAMQAVLHLLTRRADRDFLTGLWPLISKSDLMTFRADAVEDLLLWSKVKGRASQTP